MHRKNCAQNQEPIWRKKEKQFKGCYQPTGTVPPLPRSLHVVWKKSGFKRIRQSRDHPAQGRRKIPSTLVIRQHTVGTVQLVLDPFRKSSTILRSPLMLKWVNGGGQENSQENYQTCMITNWKTNREAAVSGPNKTPQSRRKLRLHTHASVWRLFRSLGTI